MSSPTFARLVTHAGQTTVAGRDGRLHPYATRPHRNRLLRELLASDVAGLLARRDRVLRSCVVAELMLERYLLANREASDSAVVRYANGELSSPTAVRSGAFGASHVLQGLALAGVLPEYRLGAAGELPLGAIRDGRQQLHQLSASLREGALFRACDDLVRRANLPQPSLTSLAAAESRYEQLAAQIDTLEARRLAAQPRRT